MSIRILIPVCAIVVLFSFTAQGIPGPQNDLRRTNFGEIKALFDVASAPSIQTAMGWHSGRCYTFGHPNAAYVGRAIIESRATDSDHGPLFSPSRTKLVHLVSHRFNTGLIEVPENFQGITDDDLSAIERSVARAFREEQFTNIIALNDSLSSTHTRTGIRYDLRRNTEYLLLRAINTRNNTEFFYCYFYQKIK